MLTGDSLIGLFLLPVGLLGLLVIARLLELAGDVGYLLTGSKLLEPSDMESRDDEGDEEHRRVTTDDTSSGEK